MAQIAILERRCTGCGLCAQNCPFGAMDMLTGRAERNAACKVCGICVKACPEKALVKLETKVESVDKSLWGDILVLAEVSGGRLHPVSLELIGKARELAGPLGFQVHSVLVGATSLGRSLAPRLSTRFHTGLTAGCTRLELRENTGLVQIRPAFGGNIMAQIVTPNTRPQFATVRHKGMDQPIRRDGASGEVLVRGLPKGVAQSKMRHVSTVPVPASTSISDAEILVVGGRGLQKEADLEMIRELASLLGGDWAVSRPLVEKGWAANDRQIGLSGRTVRPKLIITCGVSGAIQFAACMNASDHIVAINNDGQAPIFDVAHIAIAGDLYQIVPGLIAKLKEGKA